MGGDPLDPALTGTAGEVNRGAYGSPTSALSHIWHSEEALVPARKKDPSARARANQAATRATITRPTDAEIPDLPIREAGWHQLTRDWWNDVWSSPMSSEWDESDVHNVLIAAAVYDDMWTAETAKERKDAAAEYRLQRVDLGLSPYSRRRLEWTIESADEAKERGRQRRERRGPAPQPSADAEDPRNVLRAVK